ncbi:MspA family porin [Tsukamurella soli]|uniref:MspA protein n=1 Tax=Tsukamurella soli TaxID=644556 RepID=A0ABP8KEH6_9ACTN
MSKVGKAAVRVGVAAAVVATAASALASGAANADTYVPLPNGTKNLLTGSSLRVVLSSTGNHVKILPSLATAQTRTTWVTSNAHVDVSGGDKSTSGTLNLYVISGCQFPNAIGASFGATGGPTAGLGVGTTGVSPSAGVAGGATGGLSIPLTPGTTQGVAWGSSAEYPWTAQIDGVNITGNGRFNVGMKDYDINYSPCSGYAQARVVTWLELTGNSRVEGFLYGAPFSLG